MLLTIYLQRLMGSPYRAFTFSTILYQSSPVKIKWDIQNLDSRIYRIWIMDPNSHKNVKGGRVKSWVNALKICRWRHARLIFKKADKAARRCVAELVGNFVGMHAIRNILLGKA